MLQGALHNGLVVGVGSWSTFLLFFVLTRLVAEIPPKVSDERSRNRSRVSDVVGQQQWSTKHGGVCSSLLDTNPRGVGGGVREGWGGWGGVEKFFSILGAFLNSPISF